MQIFAFLSLISSIIILVLGIFVYSTNWRSQFNRIFLFLCVMAFYWAFMESMLRDANSISSAFVWMKLTAFWTFSRSAATLHFTLDFTESKFLRRSRLGSLFSSTAPRHFSVSLSFDKPDNCDPGVEILGLFIPVCAQYDSLSY